MRPTTVSKKKDNSEAKTKNDHKFYSPRFMKAAPTNLFQSTLAESRRDRSESMTPAGEYTQGDTIEAYEKNAQGELVKLKAEPISML